MLMIAFDLKNLYDFKIDLISLQSQLKKENRDLNDLRIFDIVLSSPNSGKFVELCLKAGASFYKVRNKCD